MGALLRAVALFIAVVACVGLSGQFSVRESEAADPVPLTVSITRVKVLDDGLEGFLRSTADLYAGFAIGSSTFTDCGTMASHGHDQVEIFPTTWTCSADIFVSDASSPGFTNLDLQIWDHDECDVPSQPFCNDDDVGVLESGDDQADISPGTNSTLSLSVNLADGKWSSAGGTTDVAWPQNCAQGTGDNAVLICFEISVDSESGDADGDFLYDSWERLGYNADGDGDIDVDLPGMGASPGRKDIFVEIDCVADTASNPITLRHTHCPIQAAMQDVVRSFANAPVGNPDGSTGIAIHLDVGPIYGYAAPGFETIAGASGVSGTLGNHGGGGSQIAEAGAMIIDWDGGGSATNFYTLKQANFDTQRAAVFRYTIFGHQTNARATTNDCTSGWAEGVTRAGNDLIVTLGGVNGSGNDCWTPDANGNSIGSRGEQAGTFMHELGHTLGLGHGGGDSINNKVNYLSVMNYTFQACSLVPFGPLPGGCDFSRDDLDDLNEVLPPGIDECDGIDNGLYGFGPVDFDGSGGLFGPDLDGDSCTPASSNIQINLNGDYDDANDNDSQDPGEADTLGTLAGYDDWDRLKYNFRLESSTFGDGSVPPFPNEATPEILADARAAFAALIQPDLDLDKSGPANAIPGDTLNYTLDVDNVGSGPALNVAIVDTKPDGTTSNFSIGTLVAGADASRLLSYNVACTVADGTVLVNSAAASGVDMLGNTFSANDSVSTTIHAPVLTLTKTATSSVAAGEAILYRLTYANTGTGAAANVAIVDTLPAGVYYSVALDGGTQGPRPTSATRNASGQWVLRWDIGSLVGSSGNQVIEFTARPTLLFTGGDSLVNSATISYTNANGCVYTPVNATATTTIVVLTPSGDPQGLGYWRNTPGEFTAEILARIQATDQRFDGADGSTPDGALSAAEVAATLVPGGNMDKVLEEQLLATYANLATRRFNANTALDSKLTTDLGLANVAEAAIFAQETLTLAVNSSTRGQFSDSTTVLDRANAGRGLIY